MEANPDWVTQISRMNPEVKLGELLLPASEIEPTTRPERHSWFGRRHRRQPEHVESTYTRLMRGIRVVSIHASLSDDKSRYVCCSSVSLDTVFADIRKFCLLSSDPVLLRVMWRGGQGVWRYIRSCLADLMYPATADTRCLSVVNSSHRLVLFLAAGAGEDIPAFPMVSARTIDLALHRDTAARLVRRRVYQSPPSPPQFSLLAVSPRRGWVPAIGGRLGGGWGLFPSRAVCDSFVVFFEQHKDDINALATALVVDDTRHVDLLLRFNKERHGRRIPLILGGSRSPLSTIQEEPRI